MVSCEAPKHARCFAEHFIDLDPPNDFFNGCRGIDKNVINIILLILFTAFCAMAGIAWKQVEENRKVLVTLKTNGVATKTKVEITRQDFEAFKSDVTKEIRNIHDDNRDALIMVGTKIDAVENRVLEILKLAKEQP